jgi:hypothetical protein
MNNLDFLGASVLAILGLSWFAGMLRALYFYFLWVRSLKMGLRWLVILVANICPVIFIGSMNFFQNSQNNFYTFFTVLSCLGVICMTWYLGIFGFIQTILLYKKGAIWFYHFWARIKIWKKILLIAVSLDIVLWKLFF